LGLTLEVRQHLNRVMETAVSFGITDVETIPVSLEEIFMAYYGQGEGGHDA
jgi:hypothetical protein